MIFLAAFSLLSAPSFVPAPALAAGPEGDFDKQMDAYLAKDANLEKLGGALEAYFRKQREQQQQQAQKAEVDRMENQFKNPVKFDLSDAAFRGNKDAKVTIVEFSDFQCPYCQRGAKIVDEILKIYPNDVKVTFKNYPLPFHSDAKPAAKAALAAKNQGKFWEYHDLLFANQDGLNKENFIKWAKELGLDADKFAKDMDDPAEAKKIETDMELGMQNGVQGTPAFFINGVMLSGAQPVDAFKVIIERWLKGGAAAPAAPAAPAAAAPKKK